MSAPKICRDCKFYRPETGFAVWMAAVYIPSRCTFSPRVNLELGNEYYRNPKTEREHGLCGPEGKNWEPREEPA